MSSGHRNYGRWFKQTVDELNGVGGIASLGGAAISAASLSLLAGTAALLFASGGAVVVLGSVGYAVYKATPEPSKTASDVVGKIVTLQEAREISPPIALVSVVGASFAGKTTLRNRLSFDSTIANRTQSITAKVVALQSNPQVYVGILDGGGDKMAQQFAIALAADCLCIFVDHNISDQDANIDTGRLNIHKELMEQIRLYLDEYSASKKLWINLVINKKDLWGSDLEEKRRLVHDFFSKELILWKTGARASNVELSEHSNNSTQDVTIIMEKLTRVVSEHAKAQNHV